ncbi:MAG: hypothetical protein E6517_09995, partial [Intestinibacter bartlettii]|nr:hypothetical protein [Intestinibacter bartlettii]
MSNKVDLKNNQSNKKPKPADYLNIAICSLIMIFFFIPMFFTTNGGVSQQEKRDLATFPKLSELTAEKFFSGDFLSQIDEFYKDNFVHRQEFLALSDNINTLKGV